MYSHKQIVIKIFLLKKSPINYISLIYFYFNILNSVIKSGEF